MRSRLIAIAASAALFFAPALTFAAPTWAPSQGGTVGPNVACTASDGSSIRCIQPSVTLNDATGAALGTSGNPVVTSSTGTSAAVVSTNASTTVTAGGTYQTVFASSTSRKGCTIQNPTTATEILSVRVKSLAVFTLPIGASFQCGGPAGLVISDLIEVTGATTGHAFTAVSQ